MLASDLTGTFFSVVDVMAGNNVQNPVKSCAVNRRYFSRREAKGYLDINEMISSIRHYGTSILTFVSVEPTPRQDPSCSDSTRPWRPEVPGRPRHSVYAEVTLSIYQKCLSLPWPNFIIVNVSKLSSTNYFNSARLERSGRISAYQATALKGCVR